MAQNRNLVTRLTADLHAKWEPPTGVRTGRLARRKLRAQREAEAAEAAAQEADRASQGSPGAEPSPRR